MTNERSPNQGSLVRRILSASGVLLLALFAVALLFGAPFCPSAGFLGVPCPGCGMTRATLALLSGDVERAHSFHPLVTLAAPTLAALLAYAIHGSVREPSTRSSPRATRTVTALAAALLVSLLFVWVARFFGYFGGPVEVTTYAEWLDSLSH